MKSKINRTGILLVAIGLYACTGSGSLDFKSYVKYMADEENGLVQEKSISGLSLKVKYLPNDYLVYNMVKEANGSTPREIDSIRQSFANSLTFKFTLGPGAGEIFDVTRLGVENYDQFVQRIETMSFHMQDFLTMEIAGKKYYPELTQMETMNTGDPTQSIIVVFKAPDEEGQSIESKELDFIYNDELFYTGISRFSFKMKDLETLPRLDLAAIN